MQTRSQTPILIQTPSTIAELISHTDKPDPQDEKRETPMSIKGPGKPHMADGKAEKVRVRSEVS